MTVLHLRNDGNLPQFLFTDAFIGQGQNVTLHIDNPDVKQTDIFMYTVGPDGKTRVRSEVVDYPFGCGCP